MKKYTILAVLAVLTVFGVVQQAQAVPSVRGITAFSSQAKYMSLAGYLRWQCFMENNIWISREEAGDLVKSQEVAGK